jgi:hypothetical protein
LALIVLRFRKLLTNPKVFSLALIALALFSYFHSFLLTFVDIICLFAVALATALDRVALLETEPKATTKAFKDANDSGASRPVGNPQEEGMMSTMASFPQYETKV